MNYFLIVILILCLHFAILESSRIKLQKIKIPGYQQTKQKVLQKSNSEQFLIAQLQLQSNYGFAYIGTVQVGSGQTSLKAIIDTVSPFIWFSKKNCATCTQSGIKNYFDCYYSSTCVKTNYVDVSEDYYFGKARGELIQDTIYLSGVQVNNQDFLYVKQITLQQNFPADGLIGLGPTTQNAGLNTLLFNLYQQGQIQQRLFTLFIGNPFRLETESYLDIGQIDNNLYEGETINYCSLTSDTMWAVKLSNIQLQNNFKTLNITSFTPDFRLSSNTVLIDSVPGVLAFPIHDFDAILKALNSLLLQCHYVEKYHQIICLNKNIKEYPDFKIQLCDQHELVLPNYQYVICDLQSCLVRISQMKVKSISIFGDLFMQSYFTVFDQENNRMGFAPRNHSYINLQKTNVADCLYLKALLLFIISLLLF